MRKIYVLIFFLTFSTQVFSQEQSDYDHYSDKTGDKMMIFRGPIPLEYMGISIGNPFFHSADFIKGKMVYRGREYDNLLLNLNCHTSKLYIRNSQNNLTVTLKEEWVDSFSLGDKEFIRVNSEITNLPSGYYQVYHINDGKTQLLKRTVKDYYEEIDRGSISLKKGFKTIETFYLEKEGIWYSFAKKSDLYKCFRDSRRVIKKIEKERLISFKEDSNRAFVEIIDILMRGY